MHKDPSFRLIGLLCAVALAAGSSAGAPATAQAGSRYFPETGHTVQGAFLAYWESHGGLAQQGYPLSEEIPETSDLDRQPYTVQYFERAIFEWHPEYAGTPYAVLLSLLGVYQYHLLYPLPYGLADAAPGQHPSADNPRFFAETGHTVGGTFRAYWESHGGLAQQGYPISDEFTEVSSLDHQPHTVQYFQRAVFEWHPEHAGTPGEVLLAQLGTYRYQARYATGPLTIPGPSLPDRIQSAPLGSAADLIWSEESLPAAQGYRPPNADIFGLDLKTGHPLTITNALGEQTNPALSGALVVWQNGEATYQTGDHDILGQDLATGVPFAVATGPVDQRLPAIAGRTVAWVEGPLGASRVLLKNLDSGTTTVVEVLPTERAVFGVPVMDDRYLAWTEETWRSRDSQPFRIQVYTRATGQVKTMLESSPIHDGYLPLGLALLDRRLPVASPIPLDDQTVLARSGPDPDYRAVVGTPAVLVWSSGGAILGQRLTDSGPVHLVSAASGPGRLALAGPWLVWEHAGRLASVPLAAAFAGQANPPYPPTPTPVPTPAAITANLHSISIFEPDEGWAVGAGGTMLFWDGGDRWQPQRFPRTDHALTSVDLVPVNQGPAQAADQGWAVGDGVIIPVAGPTTSDPLAVTGRLNSVQTLTADDAWAVGGNAGAPLIMHYTGGAWTRVALPFTGYTLTSIDMITPAEGWAVGDGPALHYQAGQWSVVPLPAVGQLNGVAFGGSGEGWAVGNSGALLHYRADRWEVAPSPGPMNLQGVSMRGSSEGWAVGDGGTILHYHGGTWTLAPSPTHANLRGLERRLTNQGVPMLVGDGGTILRSDGQGGWLFDQARPYPAQVP